MILHIVNWYHAKGNEWDRMCRALNTWNHLEAHGILTKLIMDLPRNGRIFGESEKPVPFIRDLLDIGASGTSESDLLVLTNADSCMVSDSREWLDKVEDVGWCYRRDFERPVRRILTYQQVIDKGRRFWGADCFAVRAGVWRKMRESWPDMVMGFGGWDTVMRKLMDITKGSSAQIPTIVYHETHGVPYWMHVHTSSGCGRHNIKMVLEWTREQLKKGVISRLEDVECYRDYEKLGVI